MDGSSWDSTQFAALQKAVEKALILEISPEIRESIRYNLENFWKNSLTDVDTLHRAVMKAFA